MPVQSSTAVPPAGASQQTGPYLRPNLLAVLLISAFYLACYLFLHEGGHALAAVLSGGTLDEFHYFAAHVSTSGSFTPFQEALKNAAGMGLPTLIWLLVMLALPKRAAAPLEILKFVSSVSLLGSLLPWVVIPLVMLNGYADLGEDVVKFVQSSGLSAFAISGGALLLLAFGIALALRKSSGIARLRAILSGFEPVFAPASRPALAGLAAVFVIVAAGVLVLTVLFPPRSALAITVPDGYTLASQVDLSADRVAAQSVARFEVTAAGQGAVYVLIENASTRQFEITLARPDGEVLPLLRADDYASNRDSVSMEQLPQAGWYEVFVRSQGSTGKLSIYTRSQ